MHKRVIREIAPGGGQVTPWTLVSKRVSIGIESRGYDSAEILDRAIMDGRSVIKDFAKLMDSARIDDTLLREFARVGGHAFIYGSEIFGTADIRGDAIIEDSKVGGNVLIGGKTHVSDSYLDGNARILDNADLINVFTAGDPNDNYIVAGDARLHFDKPMELYPGTRVERGLWHRPPFVIDTLFHKTIEDVDDKVRIGCISHNTEHWFKNGKNTLLGFGLDASLYPQFEEAMVKMRDHKKEFGSPSTKRNKK